MRKKNRITLYNAELIILGVILLIALLGMTGCTQKQVKKEYEERLAREKTAIPYYSDDKLIAGYYQIEVELQGLLDDLESARGQATRHSLEQSRKKNYSGGGAVTGFLEGFSKGFNPGVIRESVIKTKIDVLRQVKALYLTEFYKRGLRLPR